MKKILFPTDFSEASKHAFIYALKLAENINAEVIALHVYELPQLNYVEAPTYLSEVYDSVELSSFENYKDQIPSLRSIAEYNNLGHIKLSSVLMDGDFVSNVLDIVKRDYIDYVVMGSKGASGLKETFSGSLTGKIMTETDAFVLGIPADSDYQPIKNICFTTRFSKDDAVAFRKVIEIAKGFGAHVDCLYVKTPKAHDSPLSLEFWKSAFEDEDVTFHIVESRFVEAAILNFVEKQKINMLSMLNYKRGFIMKLFNHSLTKRLAFDLKVPLLALHVN
jgi:nucleotide-binding universal stress UspA family protein